MAFINKEKLLEEARAKQGGVFAAPVIVNLIEKAPEVDVIEVVRCKDCKLFVDNKKAFVQYCKRELKNLTVRPNDFCSYGKRKEVLKSESKNNRQSI